MGAGSPGAGSLLASSPASVGSVTSVSPKTSSLSASSASGAVSPFALRAIARTRNSSARISMFCSRTSVRSSRSSSTSVMGLRFRAPDESVDLCNWIDDLRST
eukprot:1622855-Pleurochrysis_carterae.AAC.2